MNKGNFPVDAGGVEISPGTHAESFAIQAVIVGHFASGIEDLGVFPLQQSDKIVAGSNQLEKIVGCRILVLFRYPEIVNFHHIRVGIGGNGEQISLSSPRISSCSTSCC